MTLLLMLALLETWTVDDDGLADFARIQQAIHASAPGDVILVEPGTYPGFTLTKELSILGRADSHPGPMPRVGGQVVVLDAPSVTLGGLALRGLRIEGVSGRARIDDCSIGEWADAIFTPALLVRACAELVISGTDIEGRFPSGDGLRIEGSVATIVDGEVLAGDGTCDQTNESPSGGDAIVVDASTVVIAGCALVLGGAGVENGLVGCFGSPGDGVVAQNGSVVALRGRPGDILAGGPLRIGCCDTGDAIAAVASTVVWSGIDITFGTIREELGGQVVVPDQPEPSLEIIGSHLPGATQHIRLYGPAGESALVGLSLGASLSSLPGYADPLWLDPTTLIAVLPAQTLGLDEPWTWPLLLPVAPGLEGVTLDVQAAFPGLPAALEPEHAFLSNPDQIVVRF